MRFCTFARGGENRFGFELRPGMIVDLIGAGKALLGSGQIEDSSNLLESKDLKAWLSNGREAIRTAERIRDLVKENGEARREDCCPGKPETMFLLFWLPSSFFTTRNVTDFEWSRRSR